MRNLAFLALYLGLSSLVYGQSRYLDEVFSEVAVASDVPYAVNLSVLSGTPQPDTLLMDVYTPVGDTVSNRPLVLIFGTGNFLPPVINGGPFGDKLDSVNVEMCTRLAKLGYVAVSANYRLGWNPLPTATDDERRSTLLQAAYRGIQDARSCVRFFRKTIAEDGDPYRLDGDRVVVGGIGTGGYISLGCAFLDRESELLLPKFISSVNATPYVVPSVFGNLEGTDSTDLNRPNHPGYSSEISLAFQMGGALGDTAWINGGEVPVVSFHSPQDSFAPYGVGNVVVPTTGDIVIGDAAGGFKVQEMVNALGNQEVFVSAKLSDDFTQAANAINGGKEGFYPYIVPGPGPDIQCDPDGAPTPGGTNSDPWAWYSEPWFIGAWNAVQSMSPFSGTEANCINLAGTPNDAALARTYIDTTIGYLAPRMNLVLNATVGIADDALGQSLKVYPNPAQHQVVIQSPEQRLRAVSLMDLSGRVLQQQAVNGYELRLSLEQQAPGLYLLRIQGEHGTAVKKLQVK